MQSIDRVIKIEALSINKSLYQAVVDGEVSSYLRVGSSQSISNNGTISISNNITREIISVSGNGGPVNLNTLPFGAYTGPNGKEVIILSSELENTVTILKNDATDGSIITQGFDSIEISYENPIKAVRFNNKWYISRGM